MQTTRMSPAAGAWQEVSHKYLATYLNNHLAGAVAALELLDHLERAHAGMPTERFLAELRSDIGADRRELERLMARWQVPISRPRKLMAWLSEKMAELKLRLDDAAGAPLHLFEALEAVSVGIEGKHLLWRALAAVAAHAPALQDVDYPRLERRAEEQRQRVEVVRLAAAEAAFRTAP